MIAFSGVGVGVGGGRGGGGHDGMASEARRRLLLKGIQATLEQTERALETVGVVGAEIEASLMRLKQIRAVTEDELSNNPAGRISLAAPPSTFWTSTATLASQSSI